MLKSLYGLLKGKVDYGWVCQVCEKVNYGKRGKCKGCGSENGIG